MEAKKHTATPILPLRYSSHRQIVSVNGVLVCEVFSGSIGIEGADAMQELIVRACNAHYSLTGALRSISDRAKRDPMTAQELAEFCDAALAKSAGEQ